MNTSLPPELSEQEFYKISLVLQDKEVCLVGGQALNLWAEYYFSQAAEELQAFAPFTSKDVDYYGLKQVAAELAAELGGEVYIPRPGDPTPNTALVVAKIEGRPIQIDFLGSVLGVPKRLLESGDIEMEFPFQDGNTERYLRVTLLAPHLVLQSRGANVITLNRRDSASIRQLRAAFVVAREYVLDLLREGSYKEATAVTKNLIGWVRGSEHAKRLPETVGVDPLPMLRRISEAHEWDVRYRERTLLPTVEALEAKYAKAAARRK